MAEKKNMPWIKLWKKSVKNDLYFAEPFDKWHAWQDLLLMADETGTVKTSLRALKTRWSWSSKNKVAGHLETLSGTGQIKCSGTPTGTTITIVNWGKYQWKPRESGTPKKTQSGTHSGTQEDTIYKEGGVASQSQPPTNDRNIRPDLDELRRLCEEASDD